MARKHVTFSATIEDDSSQLEQRVRDGFTRPLLLWGHPEVGRSGLVEAAADAAGLPFRRINAQEFEGWDGFRDVSDSGHFRAVTLEKFLAKGERADPSIFTLEANEVLYLRGINLTSTRLVASVFRQMLEERKLLNNPLPEGVRIIATVFPTDQATALQLLGPQLRPTWDSLESRGSLQYPVFDLPEIAITGSDHWAVLPSVRRFANWMRRQKLAEEVIRFLEEESEADVRRATSELHASMIRESDPLPQGPSPRAFIELASLLTERRLYFSSRALKDAIAKARDKEDLSQWLRQNVRTWDPDQWIEADSSLTVRGEPVSGSAWLRHLSEQVASGDSKLDLASLPTFSAYERRSLEMWATQELGDDLGEELVRRTSVTEADLAHLR